MECRWESSGEGDELRIVSGPAKPLSDAANASWSSNSCRFINSSTFLEKASNASFSAALPYHSRIFRQVRTKKTALRRLFMHSPVEPDAFIRYWIDVSTLVKAIVWKEL